MTHGGARAAHVAISAPAAPDLRGRRHAPAAPARRLAMRLRARGAPFLPKRALVLAQELLTCGVEAIKADS